MQDAVREEVAVATLSVAKGFGKKKDTAIPNRFDKRAK